MKNINLLVWLTQLGLSVCVPLAVFVLIGVWLHQRFGWGNWVIYAGLALGGRFPGFPENPAADVRFQARGSAHSIVQRP